MVGEAEAGDGTPLGSLWRSTINGQVFSATTLGVDYIAYAVNGDRQVVGENTAEGAPVLWSVNDQGIPGGPFNLTEQGTAVAINENGRVVGWTGTTPNATLWAGILTTTLYNNASQAYDNEIQTLVVGRVGNEGFVRRVE